MATNEPLRGAIGFLFGWKMILLFITVVSSMMIYRPFCRYICPLGAFYSFFNKISFYKMKVDKNKCIDCNICTKTCKLNIKVQENPNSLECIRCGDCSKACPTKAIETGFKIK